MVDLDFGVEDWVAEAALFALIADAYREPALRGEGVRGLGWMRRWQRIGWSRSRSRWRS